MNTKKAFTLIELMVSITIIVILTLVSYAPYSYYQNKASLKITAREVSQFLYEARNMAVNWAVWNDKNVSIGVYFEVTPTHNTYVKLFSYPYDVSDINITNMEWGHVKLLKTLNLQKWILIDNLEWKSDMLFLFDSITWKLKYYTWESSVKTLYEDKKLSINFSFKWSDSPNLNKTINYYTDTNIIDY